ncbi:MAG TPA: GNAT family N-acetyltransferase [Ktedonobacterales bacterium]|jgi:RimJ/RimL family protein N-acetyltransferase
MAIGQTKWSVALDVSDAEAAAVLEQDRIWSSFMLADLLPPFRAYSRYALATRAGSNGHAACLILQHPAFTVISSYGANAGVAAILAQAALPKHALIQAQAQHLPLFERYYRFETNGRELLRMAVSARTFRPPPSAPALPVEQLTRADAAALGELYKLYPEAHFHPDQLEHGVFYGLRRDGRLLATGGTHAVAPAYGIAVLGGIFTHPEARRQGHATTITAALVVHLLAQGCRDVVLNVVAENHLAISVYTRLGFQAHVRYWTGQGICRED